MYSILILKEAVNIPGVGSKLATKVWEIMESGELRKLTELSSGEEQQALELFTNIWGVGASTARAWVHIGYRYVFQLTYEVWVQLMHMHGLHIMTLFYTLAAIVHNLCVHL